MRLRHIKATGSNPKRDGVRRPPLIKQNLSTSRVLTFAMLLSSLGCLAGGTAHIQREQLISYCNYLNGTNPEKIEDLNLYNSGRIKRDPRVTYIPEDVLSQPTIPESANLKRIWHHSDEGKQWMYNLEYIRHLYSPFDPIPNYDFGCLYCNDEDYVSCVQCPATNQPFVGPRLNRSAFYRINNGNWEEAEAIPAAEFDNTESKEIRFPIFFGPHNRDFYDDGSSPGHKHQATVVRTDEASEQQIYNKDKRTLKVNFRTYEFPYLDFVGYWNSTWHSPEENQLFANHFGCHFYKDTIRISLPSTLVRELSAFWSHRNRDRDLKQFTLSVAKCRRLCSELDISATAHDRSILYAPVLAYHNYWDRQQNVSRVLTGSYLNTGGPSITVKKNISSIRKTCSSYWFKVFFITITAILFCCQFVYFEEPSVELWCSISSRFDWVSVFGIKIPTVVRLFPDLYYEETCMANHYGKIWLFNATTWPLFKAKWFGCSIISNPHYILFSLTNEFSCSAYVWANVWFVSHKIMNALMHAINGNPQYDNLQHDDAQDLYQILYEAYLTNQLADALLGIMFGIFIMVVILPFHFLWWLINTTVSYLWSLSRKAMNRLAHALTGNIEYKSFVNSAYLPKPKKLKSWISESGHVKTATIELCDGELRKNLMYKTPDEIRGRTAVYGFDTESYSPEAFTSNQHNEEQSLYARVLAETDLPTDDLEACINWCKTNHSKLFPRMHRIKSVTFDEYLGRSNASPSVKRILRKTYNEMVAEGYSEDSVLDSSTLHAWTTRSSFVKVENNLYRSPLGVKDKAPRLIQGARPEFIVLVGPWIMALQDLLKRRWDGKYGSNILFTSGKSSEVLSDFISDHAGKVLEDDLGKFDCSIRRPWCEYEVWLCEQFDAPRAVLDLMEANIKTHGYTHHGWKYLCDGTRKSGDPYTSLMNSVINGVSHLYIYCKVSRESLESVILKRSIIMMVQGDDNIMRHYGSEINWQHHMSGLGFDSEAIYRTDLHTAEFCSNRFYLIDRGYIMGPKPGKVLAKLGYICNPPPDVSRESMMRGVALGLRKNCNFIPPIRAVIDRILELTEGHQAFFQRNFLDHAVKVKELYEPSIDVMVNLNEQYDWDFSIQAEFERSVSTLDLGDKYNCVYTELLFDRDTSGPQSIFGSMLPTATFDCVGG
jgi:hypothetical protein